MKFGHPGDREFEKFHVGVDHFAVGIGDAMTDVSTKIHRNGGTRVFA